MADFVSSLMSSTYNKIKTFCTDSRNNENLLRSNFSGTNYPSSPVIGQKCYREDLLKEYQWNGTSWVESGANSTITNEVIRSRGNLTNLDDRLAVSLNDDGTLRTNVAANISEWVISPLTVTYITSSSFSVVDNQTGVFTRNRLVKCELSASYVYASVLSSSFANGVTTVILGNPVLDSTFQQISYSVLQKQDEKYSDLLGLRKINYSYSVGDIVYPQTYASAKILKCIVAGQSGTSEITIGDIGATIIDGGVTWLVCSIRDADSVGGNIASNIYLKSGPTASFRNKLINGNFTINQRAVSGTVTLATGAYGHDRWKAGSSGCTYTFTTFEGVTALTITAGSLQQVIEGANLQTGTYTLSWVGTAQGKIGAGSYGISGITGSVAGGTNLAVEFSTGTLSKVQLEKGVNVTAFEDRDPGLELVMCRRFFEFLDLNIASSSTGVGNISRASWFFKVTKRTTPTLIQASGSYTYSVYVTKDAVLLESNVGASPNILAFGSTVSAEL